MKGLLGTCGLTLVLVASSAWAQEKTDPPRSPANPNMTMKEHCEDLVRQFNAADVKHVEATKLSEAKKQAAHGGNLCNTDPRAGVKAMDLAFKDIGTTPK